jgi:hypothetical protein
MRGRWLLLIGILLAGITGCKHSVGEACQSRAACEDGLACVQGACAPAKGEGEACTSSAICQRALRCALGVCTEAKIAERRIEQARRIVKELPELTRMCGQAKVDLSMLVMRMKQGELQEPDARRGAMKDVMAKPFAYGQRLYKENPLFAELVKRYLVEASPGKEVTYDHVNYCSDDLRALVEAAVAGATDAPSPKP